MNYIIKNIPLNCTKEVPETHKHFGHTKKRGKTHFLLPVQTYIYILHITFSICFVMDSIVNT